MLSFDYTEDHQDCAPAWWPGGVHTGHTVELLMYGDTMTGRLREIAAGTLSVTIPVPDQVPGLRLSTAHGTAVISLDGGAARVPVSCWATGDVVRLQVSGPIEFVQRREHVRRAIRLPVRLGWLRPGERTWDHARTFTVDLSLGGLQVETATTVWPGISTAVRILVDLPDGLWHAQAESVGKTAGYGLRLRFVDLSPTAAERLQRLVG